MKPQASPKRSPVSTGIYRIPIEYQTVLEVARRTIDLRQTDPDPLRRERVVATARKWALRTARSIVGEVRGWIETYPAHADSTWGSAAQGSAERAAALAGIISTTRPVQDDVRVIAALTRLIDSLNGNNY